VCLCLCLCLTNLHCTQWCKELVPPEPLVQQAKAALVHPHLGLRAVRRHKKPPSHKNLSHELASSTYYY